MRGSCSLQCIRVPQGLCKRRHPHVACGRVGRAPAQLQEAIATLYEACSCWALLMGLQQAVEDSLVNPWTKLLKQGRSVKEASIQIVNTQVPRLRQACSSGFPWSAHRFLSQGRRVKWLSLVNTQVPQLRHKFQVAFSGQHTRFLIEEASSKNMTGWDAEVIHGWSMEAQVPVRPQAATDSRQHFRT